jgi:hypothetical protein
MTEPQSKPNPPAKKSPTWPIAVNLVLLLLGGMFFGADFEAFSGTLTGLFVINTVAAIILGISGGKMHYVLAFVLACLVILLIGGGICALLLTNMGGGGH